MFNVIDRFRRKRRNWNFKPIKKKIEKSSDENNNKEIYSGSRTPAAILFELLAKEGKTPVYEILAEKPKVPHFIYRVSCGENFGKLHNFFSLIYFFSWFLTADGGARSKKKAKQAAAEAFLYSLIYKVIQFPPPKPESPPKQQTVNLNRLIEQGNFIGALQEFCRSWEMPNPTYRLEMEIGSSHTKKYFISCEVHDRKSFGSSERKKVAKQNAAEEMWTELQNDMQADKF
jgi:dsRNA-specific ribonuclease